MKGEIIVKIYIPHTEYSKWSDCNEGIKEQLINLHRQIDDCMKRVLEIKDFEIEIKHKGNDTTRTISIQS